MDLSIIDRLKKEVETLGNDAVAKDLGIVRTVGDGIVEIEGLRKASMAEMIVFDESSSLSVAEAVSREGALYGLILNLEEDSVKAIVLGDTTRLKEGMHVFGTGKLLSIPVGDALIGRVLNPLAEPVDGKGPIKADAEYPVEREAYGVIDRAPVNTPLHTGIKAIDTLIPIGRGQRELIIGDRGTGKTAVVIDTILNQMNEPAESRPICIYVAIGQKESKTARIAGLLTERGAMEYSIIVTAPASSPAAYQFLAPYAGVAMAEYFMEKGKDVLIVYDDLSKQAVAYRQLSLLLRRPPGREAYPGDIFYLHSRLLERAAKLSKEKGGGSITALPIIETQENDVSAYIPTNVISITDGQMFLESDLFNKGTRPAINVGISVSRVGSAAQTKAMKKVAGRIKLDLAQFRELAAFAQFGSDLDAKTQATLERGKRIVELFKQNQYNPIAVEIQASMLWAMQNNQLDDVAVDKIKDFQAKFTDFLNSRKNALLEKIRKEKAFSDALAAELKAAIGEFKQSYR